MRLNVGCGPHYAEGWWNTDLVQVPGIIDPDQVVTAADPLPFPDATVERAYLGHVLEHVPWADVPAFLGRLRQVLAPGGVACFVGPDTFEVLDLWKAGTEPWEKVAGIIEGTGSYMRDHYSPLHWDADRHHWNCHQDRVAEAVTDLGWSVEIIARLPDRRLDEDELRGRGWPLVDGSPCQFSIEARP